MHTTNEANAAEPKIESAKSPETDSDQSSALATVTGVLHHRPVLDTQLGSNCPGEISAHQKRVALFSADTRRSQYQSGSRNWRVRLVTFFPNGSAALGSSS